MNQLDPTDRSRFGAIGEGYNGTRLCSAPVEHLEGRDSLKACLDVLKSKGVEVTEEEAIKHITTYIGFVEKETGIAVADDDAESRSSMRP